MKLYELAKAVERTNKDLLGVLEKSGIPAKSHLSVLTEEQIQAVASEFGVATGSAESLLEQAAAENSLRKFEPDDLIPCRSVCGHRVIYTSSKTGMTYDWLQFGQIVPVAYIDLLTMYSGQSVYLFRPLILIEEEDLYLQWSPKLEGIYMAWIGLDKPEDLFAKGDEEFERIVQSAPPGMKELISTMATKLLKNGGGVTIRKVQILDDLCGTALKDLF